MSAARRGNLAAFAVASGCSSAHVRRIERGLNKASGDALAWVRLVLAVPAAVGA